MGVPGLEVISTYGPPMDPPLDPIWTPYGPPMDPLWTPYGPPMDPLWTPYGKPGAPAHSVCAHHREETGPTRRPDATVAASGAISYTNGLPCKLCEEIANKVCSGVGGAI